MKLIFASTATLLGLASVAAIAQPLEQEASSSRNLDSIDDLRAARDTSIKSVPLQGCNGFALTNNKFNMKSVVTSPSPIQKGTDVQISAQGLATERVEEGTTISLQLSKGIESHTLNFNFCDGVQNGCPVAPGTVDWVTTQYISDFMPGGHYHIQMQMTDSHGTVMNCAESNVQVK